MTRVIMGISPGSRITGIAVVTNGRLLDRSQHTKNTAAIATVSSAIREYGITHIALMQRHTDRSSPTKECLTCTIRQIAEQHAIPVVTYTTQVLRTSLPPGNHRNKRSLFAHVAAALPELEVPYHKYLRLRNPYWDKLLEAVTCAYVEGMK